MRQTNKNDDTTSDINCSISDVNPEFTPVHSEQILNHLQVRN